MGVLIAAPRSGSGKTVLTLAILRALAERGVEVAPAKAGPDYIDPAFHAVATRRPSVNLDPWAMRPETLRALASKPGRLVVEAAMGLFDGAADGSGSAADLAAMLGLPVVLVLDASGASHSLAATLRGFATHRADVAVSGVIVNRVASGRHARMVRDGLAPVCDELGTAWLGTVPRDDRLALPSRHLGLVPAAEHAGIEGFVATAARIVGEAVDLDTLLALAASSPQPVESGAERSSARAPIPPLGQRIAVARDVAFAFAYPHLLDAWHAAGASLHPFSPLADEGPDEAADAIFLPGGYPELHAERLAAAGAFREGMTRAVGRGAWVHGECGGYMALGEALTDADGVAHPMLGLLPVRTSFAERRLHLGYRQVTCLAGTPLGPAGTRLRGHEFHHATILWEGSGDRPFEAQDAEGTALGAVGLRRGRVLGSFMHLIDRV